MELKYERNMVRRILFGDHKYSEHEYNTKRTQMCYEEKIYEDMIWYEKLYEDMIWYEETQIHYEENTNPNAN